MRCSSPTSWSRTPSGIPARPSRSGLAVSVRGGTVRVTVTDAGDGFDPMAEPAATRGTGAGGWGLALVASLASRWGVDRVDDHTEVWFEIDGAPLGT